MKSVNYRTRYNTYLMMTGVDISFEDFMRVNVLKKKHSIQVGSVVKFYNKDLRIYPHMLHFGHMFFYQHLTTRQLLNGPKVADDVLGPCH